MKETFSKTLNQFKDNLFHSVPAKLKHPIIRFLEHENIFQHHYCTGEFEVLKEEQACVDDLCQGTKNVFLEKYTFMLRRGFLYVKNALHIQ